MVSSAPEDVTALGSKPCKSWDRNILLVAETSAPTLIGEHDVNAAGVEIDERVDGNLRKA